MMMERENINIQEFSQSGDTKAVCPHCKEEIMYADVEMFAACPFCGCLFQDNDDLHEFIMQPVVNNWIINGTNKNNMI